MWKIFSTQSRLGRVAPCSAQTGRDMQSLGQNAGREKKGDCMGSWSYKKISEAILR